MPRARATPSFSNLHAASNRASAAARGASIKTGTRCELVLRRELWRMGLRYRLAIRGLPGKPDLVFPRQRVVVFCDGDFWHGRNLESRLERLKRGHNASYWVAKIRRNVHRDLAVTEQLQADGWRVVRVWETDVLRDAAHVACYIKDLLNNAFSR